MKDLKTRNFSVRLPEGLISKIDQEVETYREEGNRNEFITDAVKFYLRYKEESRRRSGGDVFDAGSGESESGGLQTTSGRI